MWQQLWNSFERANIYQPLAKQMRKSQIKNGKIGTTAQANTFQGFSSVAAEWRSNDRYWMEDEFGFCKLSLTLSTPSIKSYVQFLSIFQKNLPMQHWDIHTFATYKKKILPFFPHFRTFPSDQYRGCAQLNPKSTKISVVALRINLRLISPHDFCF